MVKKTSEKKRRYESFTRCRHLRNYVRDAGPIRLLYPDADAFSVGVVDGYTGTGQRTL